MNYQELVDNTDPAMVIEGMDLIKAHHLANGEFLSDSNPLKMDSFRAIRGHFRNRHPSRLRPNDLKTYMATSVITHCFDGWIYLSHAVDSLLKGDKGIAIHLAYYAELRGTLSFLARQGISVNDRNNMGINSRGIIDSSTTGGTHVATWEYLESWMNSSSSNHVNLLNYFVVANKNLTEWMDYHPLAISPSVANQYALSWMREWSFDIQKFKEDKQFRNIVTYQPQRLRDNGGIDYKEKFRSISQIWKFLEPNGSERFSLLDKYLFAKLFDQINRNPPSGSPGNLKSICGEAFTNAGLSMDVQIEHIIDSGVANSLLLNSQEPAIDGTSGELKPLHIISRSLLMLRIASGCTRELLKSAGIANGNIDFYLKNLGNNNGHWKGPTPSNFETLWEDINDSLLVIDDLIDEPDPMHLHDLFQIQAMELHHFKQLSRACFWGSCA